MITIEQFRNDPVRVDEWRAVLSMPITQEVLALLLDDSPETKPAPQGLSPTDAAIFLGNGRGYRNHHEKLKAFGLMWPRKGSLPEPDYAPPENEEQE